MSELERDVRRVEAGLRPANTLQGQPATRWELQERMAFYRVPGLSIAVIQEGAVAWARGYGVLEPGGAPVCADTLFQAASISKPVAALGALRLVQAGQLDLDADVNRYLRSWQVPASHHTREHPVTLRGILSHSAGLTVHGFAGYPAGRELPTLLQILEGESPANSGPIRVAAEPGSRCSYSGGGYVVLQQMMEDVTGRPFAGLMRDLVLEPLGMAASSYEQPLPPDAHARAASAHLADGTPLPCRWHTYPERAAAGLWTTPSDLARFALVLMGGAPRLLEPKWMREMLTPQVGGWGLGVGLEAGEGQGFCHGGANAGYRCELAGYARLGQGAVVMTNGDNGSLLALEVVRAVSAAYGWPGWQPRERKRALADPALYRACEGTYRSPAHPEWAVAIRHEGERLYAQWLDGGLTFEIHPEGADRFFACEDDMGLTFVRDDAGRVTEVVAGEGERLVRAG